MNAFEIIIGAILIVFALLIIFVVLMQEGRQANVGVISGAADTFLDKGAAQTWDMRLAKWTKVIAITFFVLVLAGMLVTKFLSTEALSGSDKKDDTTSSATTTTAAANTSTTTAATTTAAATTTTAAK